MSTLSSADWLDLLDSSRSLPPPLRACALLDGVWQAEPGWAASLPLGQRDRQLLELQQALFGPQLELLAECPRCGERLDTHLRRSDAVRHAEDGQKPVAHEFQHLAASRQQLHRQVEVAVDGGHQQRTGAV